MTGSPGVIAVGRPLPTTTFEVTAERVARYAEAIEDPNPRFRRDGRDTSHMVAPPTLAAAYIQEPVRAMFADRAALDELGIDGTRVVFGEIEYEFAEPVRPGDWLTVEGEMTEREPSGQREILRFHTRARLDSGTVATHATITFIRL